MKHLSPRATDLVNALRRRSSFFERLTGRADSEIAILTELRSHPEPAVVPHLLPVLFAAPRVAASVAAEVLARALDASSAEELLELDEACRRVLSFASPLERGWPAMKPMDVSRFETLGPIEADVVGIASFHANGYVREAAVTRLDGLDGGRELPFLLIRLNDWVTPVAERARTAVQRRIVPAYAVRFLDSLAIIERLGLSRRRDHADLIERIYALLQQPEQRAVLLRGLGSPDRRTRRLCFRLARQGTEEDRLEVLRRALGDADTVIRLEAVAEARRTLDADGAALLLPEVLADPYPPVRREGLAIAAERLPGEANQRLRAALVDSNQVVREVARFYLRRRGEVSDFAGVYRGHLRADAGPRELAAALSGLGETGTRDDAEDVLPYLDYVRPSVRRAAVRALGVLDGDARLATLVRALGDPSRSVSRAARDQLRRSASRVTAKVHEVFRSPALPHTRRHALTLLSSLGKWESLSYLLEAAADADEKIRAIARERLEAWVAGQNRTMTQPDRDQLRSIRRAIDDHHMAVDRRIADEVGLILRFWGA